LLGHEGLLFDARVSGLIIGTLIVGDKPVETASFVPTDAEPSQSAARVRPVQKFNGGQRERPGCNAAD
jgi:hypothetical protein